MKISKKQLRQIIKEELTEDANAEQARLQQRAAIRRFETELESVISAAVYAGIPKEDISEILQVFAGSV